jgi:ubiquinone/menaquinone biosynthesis C-methylase UbiE
MSGPIEFDDRMSAQVEATYQTPDVVGQRRAVLAAIELAPSEQLLDIGSGPGLLACEAAAILGPKGAVHGVDPSESMLAIAARRERAAAAAPVHFQAADACALPFDDGSFDAAIATQAYEYVSDIPSALAEAHRVLRPGGRLLVLDTDWDSIVWHSRDPERMQRVLSVWDEHLADPHFPRTIGPLLENAGFAVTERSVLPILNAGYDPDTLSANVIAIVSDFVAERSGVTRADADAWARDLRSLGDRYFFSVNRYLFMAVK